MPLAGFLHPFGDNGLLQSLCHSLCDCIGGYFTVSGEIGVVPCCVAVYGVRFYHHHFQGLYLCNGLLDVGRVCFWAGLPSPLYTLYLLVAVAAGNDNLPLSYALLVVGADHR